MPQTLYLLNDKIIQFYTGFIKEKLRTLIEEECGGEYEYCDGNVYENYNEVEEEMVEVMWNNYDKFYCSSDEIRIDSEEIFDFMDNCVYNNNHINWECELKMGDSLDMNNLIREYEAQYIGCDVFTQTAIYEKFINAYCFVFAHNLTSNWSSNLDTTECYNDEYMDEFKKWNTIQKNYMTRVNKWIKRTPIRNFMLKYIKKITKKKTACLMLDKLKIIDADIKSEILKNF